MTEKNLVPLPDGDRRGAARVSRTQRRERYLAERRQGTLPVEVDDNDIQEVPAPSQEAQLPAAPTFVLPPRVQLEKTRSTFGRIARLSFFLCVLLPVVVVALFYAFMASPQYATTSMFAVRGSADSSGAMDGAGLFAAAGGSVGGEIADSFIVQEYIMSRAMVEDLVAEANFLEVYSRPGADPYYRLDPSLPIEGLVEYWNMMASVEYTLENGIMTLVVRAFRPSDAEAITRKVIEKSEALVNEISMRAREDSVRAAQREVDLAETRYADARKAVASYRGVTQEISPEKTAEARQSVVGSLEAEVAQLESQLTALRATMSDNSPRVTYVRNQLAALRNQIDAERRRVSVADDGSAEEAVLTERLSRYEELVAEREFALNQYQSSYETLEAARVEALKQQRYLTVFVRGEAPEKATFPEALRWIAIVGVTCFFVWGLCILVAAAIRDRTA
ncbi:hypothetical protein [Acuticoccus yangtzensis]|uniref:hypothetical protein n=1 Tax=Acuticoccus yangtzensis TaxID=1443441 RepID=UPI000949A0FB|nr:hypothetical protein [Acuticoccus yangtzensis]ORE94323.1 RkpR, polysaccharide export protein [Stappia sp. 22II-S9-Z10]